MRAFILLFAALLCVLLVNPSQAKADIDKPDDETIEVKLNEESAVTSNFCKNFTLKSVPVGNFFSAVQLPQNYGGIDKQLHKDTGISVEYNSQLKDAYCGNGPEYVNAFCSGKNVFFENRPKAYCLDKHGKVFDAKDSVCLFNPGSIRLTTEQVGVCFDDKGKKHEAASQACLPYSKTRTIFEDKDWKKFCVNSEGKHLIANSNTCMNGEIKFGHDGIDMPSNKKNIPVRAIQPMLIVASHMDGVFQGWGESIIGATRVSEFSEEILTYHYHHLYAVKDKNGVKTSRQYNACWFADKKKILAKSGKTGAASGVHLHFSERRWKNLAELQKAIGNGSIYGKGYVYEKTQLLDKHLSPRRTFSNTFEEFDGQESSPLEWFTWVRTVRQLGAEQGEWDGKFLPGKPMTRGQVSGWLNVLNKVYVPLEDLISSKPAVFEDVKKGTEFFSYVQNLTSFPDPTGVSIIDRNATCQPETKKFCPENEAVRAMALKMIILSFYREEYFNYAPNALTLYANMLATIKDKGAFTDVPIVFGTEWFTPYVYFGLHQGIVYYPKDTQLFRPKIAITRVEMAKWGMLGYEKKFYVPNDPCAGVFCEKGSYCFNKICVPIPKCVSAESQDCTKGGGDGLPPAVTSCSPGLAQCKPGEVEKNTCVDGVNSQVRTCSDFCVWGAWSDCPAPPLTCTPGESQDCGFCGTQTCDANGAFGACLNEQACAPSSTQVVSCPDGSSKTQSCSDLCNWEDATTCPILPSCTCAQGECCDGCNFKPNGLECGSVISKISCANSTQVQEQTMQQYCSGTSTNCDGKSLVVNSVITQTCSGNELCVANGNSASCQMQNSSCTDGYSVDQPQSCFSNPTGEKYPELCLEAKVFQGSQWQYRICRTGGALYFIGGYKWEVWNAGFSDSFSAQGQVSGGNAQTCLPWQTLDASIITKTGPSNGLWLRGKITPTTCKYQPCYETTGDITVSKTCQ